MGYPKELFGNLVSVKIQYHNVCEEEGWVVLMTRGEVRPSFCLRLKDEGENEGYS